MKSSFIIILLALASSGSAYARSCGANDAQLISAGLKARAQDSSLPGEERAKASFVSTQIANESRLQCDMESGIAGNTYELATSTHQISINFLGSSISQVQVERTGFN